MTPEIEKRIKAVQAGRVPAGYKKTKVGIVPKEWDVFSLKNISTELHETAGNGRYETLSISAGVGFVNQTSKFGKDISGAQYAKYTVLKKGDFSYNKGNSKKYPQGCVYQLKDRDEAVVPNVFESFRLINGENDFFEQLFINGFLNGQLFSKINHGVRDDGLLNLRGDDFYSCQVPFPPLSEQKKIAEILATQDRVIELKEKLIAEKQKQKKYLMRVLLGDSFKSSFKLNGEIINKKKWKKIKINSVLKKVDKPVIVDKNTQYTQIGIYSHGKGLFYKEPVTGKELGNKSVFWIEPNCFILNIVFAWEQALAKTTEKEKGLIASHRFPMFKPIDNLIDIDYAVYYFLTKKGTYILDAASPGGAGRNRTLGQDRFLESKMTLPTLPEQKAIADVLSTADEEISLLQKSLKQEKLKKKSLMQLLLTGLVRVNE
jgi:type I restriction enzyme S subunit